MLPSPIALHEQAHFLPWPRDRGPVLFCRAAPRAVSGPAPIRRHQKISATQGGFTGTIDDLSEFGSAVTNLGYLDGDGVADMAVGHPGNNAGGARCGAVWILFMNANGTVRSQQAINSLTGQSAGQPLPLQDQDQFGFSVSTIGDLNFDDTVDLAVGAFGDSEGGMNRGAVYILFLQPDGKVQSWQKINDLHGGLGAGLSNWDRFGSSVAGIGDQNFDGVLDIAVGAMADMTVACCSVRSTCCCCSRTGRWPFNKISATAKVALVEPCRTLPYLARRSLRSVMLMATGFAT